MNIGVFSYSGRASGVLCHPQSPPLSSWSARLFTECRAKLVRGLAVALPYVWLDVSPMPGGIPNQRLIGGLVRFTAGSSDLR